MSTKLKCGTCKDRGFIVHPDGWQKGMADCPDCSTDDAVQEWHPGQSVQWVRGGGWAVWRDGKVESVTDNVIVVAWRRYDSKTGRWVTIRRHCRRDQLVPTPD